MGVDRRILSTARFLYAAPMADATGETRENGVEKAKEAISELVTEEVTEDLGVGEQRPEHKQKTKSGKPRFGSSGVRQTWDACVGEEDELCLTSSIAYQILFLVR